jgi:hypothetical protein
VHGRGVIGDGLVIFVPGYPRATAADVAARVLGIEPDGLGEIGDGLVVVLLHERCRAALAVDVGGDQRIEPEHKPANTGN